MRSSNPLLRDNVMAREYAIPEQPMTIQGTAQKLLMTALIMIASAALVYYQYSLQRVDYVMLLTSAGLVISFIAVLICRFFMHMSPYLVPVYAFAEGAALSGVSCILESRFPGIVLQAVSVTFLVVLVVAGLYMFQIIRATRKFVLVVTSATIAIALFYLIYFLLMLFGIEFPYFRTTSTLSLFLNIIFALVASLNLVLDFSMIERMAAVRMPAFCEWYGALSLATTIAWMYIEILNIIARLNRR